MFSNLSLFISHFHFWQHHLDSSHLSFIRSLDSPLLRSRSIHAQARRPTRSRTYTSASALSSRCPLHNPRPVSGGLWNCRSTSSTSSEHYQKPISVTEDGTVTTAARPTSAGLHPGRRGRFPSSFFIHNVVDNTIKHAHGVICALGDLNLAACVCNDTVGYVFGCINISEQNPLDVTNAQQDPANLGRATVGNASTAHADWEWRGTGKVSRI
jgi:hypothetical protein